MGERSPRPYHGTPSAAVRNFCSGDAARQARVKRLRKSAAQASRSAKRLTSGGAGVGLQNMHAEVANFVVYKPIDR